MWCFCCGACDRFAIWFFTGKKSYDESKIRSHLLLCLEGGKFVPFTWSTETRQKLKQILTLIDVYCKSRTPFFESDTDKNCRVIYDGMYIMPPIMVGWREKVLNIRCAQMAQNSLF